MTKAGNAPQWFRSPGEPFRPSIFWFWHRLPTKDEIVASVGDMASTGIGRAMIQARPAMPLSDYLSPAYLDAYRFAAREACRQGLRLTIYDEYGWMSGHGGGNTVGGADHLRERHLFWVTAPVTGRSSTARISGIASPFLAFLGDIGSRWLYDEGQAVWGDWQPVRVVRHGSKEMDGTEKSSSATRFSVQADGDDCCVLRMEFDEELPRDSMITAFVTGRCLSSRLVNYLEPEAATRFADLVYAPLADAAGDAADSFFFDHPHAGFYIWNEIGDALGNSVLWNDLLAASVSADQLLALAGDFTLSSQASRASFLELYSARLHEAFFGTLSRWAAARRMEFTGHELLTHVGGWELHDGLKGFDPRAMPGVDYFGVDRFRTTTAVDAADYAPQLSAKLGDSVARASGRKRCIVEQYSTGRERGAAALSGQWDLTAARFRAQAIRHHLFGARQILLHAYNLTDGCDGDGLLSPRFDFPPAFNFEPWWEDCPAMFAELSRLSAFLEDGEPVRPVALFYPLETIRAQSFPPRCGQHFGWWAKALAEAGIGFDILDETNLSERLPKGYRALVLPSVSRLAHGSSLEAIALFAQGGGDVHCSGGMDTVVRNANATSSETGLRFRLEGIGKGSWRDHSELGPEEILRLVAGFPRPDPDVRFETGQTWSAALRHDGGWKVAAFNDENEPRRLRISCSAAPVAALEWVARTGHIVNGGRGGDGTLVFEMEPHQLLCLSLTADTVPWLPLRKAAPLRSQRVMETVVLDKNWTLAVGGGERVPIAVDRGWELQGFSKFCGSGSYRGSFKSPPEREGGRWFLVLQDVRDTVECNINGVRVGHRIAGDAAFPVPEGTEVLEVDLTVRNTAANRYYPGTVYDVGPLEPSGIIVPPILVFKQEEN